jgi:hypothetical protein
VEAAEDLVALAEWSNHQRLDKALALEVDLELRPHRVAHAVRVPWVGCQFFDTDLHDYQLFDTSFHGAIFRATTKSSRFLARWPHRSGR